VRNASTKGAGCYDDTHKKTEAVAKTRGTVLLVGESGAGKELVARALHEAGSTNRAPFVAFNCAVIPKELYQSELFGSKRGAFSGANTEYLGLFRAGEGGTLFLDEISEMALETRANSCRLSRNAQYGQSVRPVKSRLTCA
jgi:DNA-binding NtrC family response regulator